MKKLINIFLSVSCVLLLAGCEGMRDAGVSVLSQFEGKTATQIYQQGEVAFQAKRYHEAIRSFKLLNRLHRNNPHTQTAHSALIDCYSAAGQIEDAIQEIDRFIRLYPRSKRSQVLKRKQIALKRQKAMQDIKQQYENAMRKCRDLESQYREKMKRFYREHNAKVEWEAFKNRNHTQYRAFVKSLQSVLNE